jgi:hypothetical protein
MSSVRRLDTQKLRTVRIIATATITATIAFLLLSIALSGYWLAYTSAVISAAPPAARPSYQAADEQVPSDRTPREPDHISASGMPRSEASPSPEPGVVANSEDSSPEATEQRTFRSRRALETIDAREVLRRAK